MASRFSLRDGARQKLLDPPPPPPLLLEPPPPPPELLDPPPPHFVIIEKNVTAQSSGPIANFSLLKQFGQSSLAKLEYSRQLGPGGRGTQTTSDRIGLRAELKLKQNWLLTLSGSQDMRTSQGGLFAGDSNRDFTELRGALRYDISREWSTTGTYRFAYRQNTGLSTDAASGHAVMLSLDYNGLPRAISSLNGL